MQHLYSLRFTFLVFCLFGGSFYLLGQPYYVNCGPANNPTSVGGGITFVSDAGFVVTIPPDTNTGSTNNGGGNSAEQDNTDLDEVYRSERWKNGDLNYEFTVTPGVEYIVDLYFSETFSTSANARVFDVEIEGVEELPNFDVYVAAGNADDTAVKRSFFVTAPDNKLNIDLLQNDPVIGNPKISGIVIRESSTPNTPPELNIVSPINGFDFDINQTISFSALKSDLESPVDPLDMSGNWYTTSPIEWYLLDYPNPGEETKLTEEGSDFTKPATDFGLGSYTLEARVTDSDGATGTESITFSVSRDPIVTPFYMNASGSGDQMVNGIQWSDDDEYVSQGTVLNFSIVNNNPPRLIAGTEFDEVFQTEKYGDNSGFAYTFPVDNNKTYTVELLFAEISNGQASPGAREFHVDINGTRELTSFDIFSEAGGSDKAIKRIFTTGTITSGIIEIVFTQISGANNPKVSGIIICEGTSECNASILPVTYLDWRGRALPDRAELFWSTTAERDNYGFYVESSPDGRTFREIGFVAGNGDSEQVHDYTFTDERFVGDTYYRLRQIDFDGSFEYSTVIQLKHPDPGKGRFRLYPNPVTDRVVLVAPGEAWDQRPLDAALYGVDGRLLLRLRGTPGQLSEQLTAALPTTSGRLFWLRLTYDDRTEQLPLLR